MERYTIYEKATGRILRNITCDSASDIGRNHNYNSESFLLGYYSPSEYYVENSVAIRISDKPDCECDWDYVNKCWSSDADEINSFAMFQLRAERDKRIDAVQWRLQRWRDETTLGKSPTTEDGSSLLAYVQALRDMPETVTDPTNPTWPIAP